MRLLRKSFKRAGFLIFNKHPKRDKFTSKPYEYFRQLIKNFDKEHLRIYVAKYNNEPLVLVITFEYGKEIFYLYSFLYPKLVKINSKEVWVSIHYSLEYIFSIFLKL